MKKVILTGELEKGFRAEVNFELLTQWKDLGRQ